MDIKITVAIEAKDIAADLIDEVHPHLRTARILYLFTTQKTKKCEAVVLGKAKKLSALQKFLSSGNQSVGDGYDFILQFDIFEWKELTEAQRRALVDHELCHCGIGESGWKLRGHDIEEFRAVIERHGDWKRDVRAFIETAQQLPLVQPERGLVDSDTTVTISALGQSVTVTGKQFHDAAIGATKKD